MLPPTLERGCGRRPQHSSVMRRADEEVQCHGRRSAVFMRSVIKADSLPRSMIYTLPIATGTCRGSNNSPAEECGIVSSERVSLMPADVMTPFDV